MKADAASVSEQIAVVSRAVSDVTRASAFDVFKTDSEGKGMEALMGSGSAAQDFWSTDKGCEAGGNAGSGKASSESPAKMQTHSSGSVANLLAKEADEEFDPQAQSSRLQLQSTSALRTIRNLIDTSLQSADEFTVAVKDLAQLGTCWLGLWKTKHG